MDDFCCDPSIRRQVAQQEQPASAKLVDMMTAALLEGFEDLEQAARAIANERDVLRLKNGNCPNCGFHTKQRVCPACGCDRQYYASESCGMQGEHSKNGD